MADNITPLESHQSVGILPFALSQQQVWLDQLAYPTSPHLNIGGVGFINDHLDLALLEAALQQLVTENLALRLLPLTNGSQQLVKGWQGPLLDFTDQSEAADPDHVIRTSWRISYDIPFALDGKTRPWIVTVQRVNPRRYGILIKFHHLIMDGYSVALTLMRFSLIYNALCEPHLWQPPRTTEFTHFIHDSSQYLTSDGWQQDAHYWHSLFPKSPPLLFTAKRDKSEIDSSTASLAHHQSLTIPANLYQQLIRLAKDRQITIFHLFIATLALYFCRCLAKDELVIGIPLLNRKGKRYKETLGMFAVMIPLKITLDPTACIGQLFTTVSRAIKGAYRHARYPLSTLSRDLDMFNQGQQRLFDLVLSFEIQNMDILFGQSPLTEMQQAFTSVARYPLSITVCEFHAGEPVEVIFEASNDYFDPSQTALISQRILHLLQQMLADPEQTSDKVSLLPEPERYALLVDKHAQVPHHPDPLSFIAGFEHQAALRPANIAIRWQTHAFSPITTLNYHDLNLQANRLAHHLYQRGLKKNAVVAVIMPRQVETMVAFLAIAKACAAFVPIDPDAPIERILSLVKSSNAAMIISTKTIVNLQHLFTLPTVLITGESAAQYDTSLPSHNLDCTPSADTLAYLLFTSGSTGEPKGVLMEHAPLARRLAWLARTFNITPKDIALQSIQLTFDPALIEIFLSLTQGGSIALPPPGQIAPVDIARLAETFAATCIIFVPTTLHYFNQTAHAHPQLKLRIAISGGEVLYHSMANAFIKNTGATLFNLYGPTEACVFATAHQFDPKISSDPLPIGLPVDDSRIYILDPHLQPLPWGEVGEIFIGGNALARGYLNAPQATAQCFIADPFVPGARLYRSGDAGYWDLDGLLHFVGRVDDQIKLNGHRIEPSQIETVLNELAIVEVAAVQIVNQQLHAWVVLNGELNDRLFTALNQTLRQKLPSYMIPSGLTPLPAMPRQTSGKIDLKALVPAPYMLRSKLPTTDITPPRSDLERLLVNLWTQVLGPPAQGINSRFFASGGNSITGLALLSAIETELGERLPLSIVLQDPTIARLALAIIEQHQPLAVNLSNKNKGTVIYLAASGHGDALRFKPLASALGPDYCLVMLQPPSFNGSNNYHSINELAEHYVSMIEQRHHLQPPIIAGFSIGGIAALETARRLVARGIATGPLLLIDTTYPNWVRSRALSWQCFCWLVKALRLQELSINQRTLGSLSSDPGLNSQIAVLKHYQASSFSLPTTLILSSGLNRWHRFLFQPWHKLQKNHLTEYLIDGFHGTIFFPEHVDELAALIRRISQP